MQDRDNPRVELFWKLDGAESGLVGSGVAAGRLIAVYRLDAYGGAVREGGPDWLDDVRVIEAGELICASEGERYLRALPNAFSGTLGRAVLIDEAREDH